MAKIRNNKTAEASPNEIALSNHARELGFYDLQGYVAWRREIGLPSGIPRTAVARKREVACRMRQRAEESMRASRRFRKQPDQVLDDIIHGKLQHQDIRLPHLQAVASHIKKNNNPGARGAYFKLLLAVQEHAPGLFDLEPVIPRFGWAAGNRYVDALYKLAENRRLWIRDPASWRPTTHNARKQFSQLARHLTCEYDVPVCFDSVWFKCHRVQPMWFRSAGAGTSLRRIGFPIELTKRMAHALLQSPAEYSLEEGLRWAQAIGMGASDRMARAIVATHLGEDLRDDEFWKTVVLLIVENPLLDPSGIGPLIDYLRYERTGRLDRANPDRLPPGFTMKGRTVDSLLRRVDAWHHGLQKLHTTARREWPSCGIQPFYWTEESEVTPRKVDWSIREILTAKELVEEGRAMSHCVASYGHSCAIGAISIWTLRAHCMDEARRVLTVAVRAKRITEARGRFNTIPGAVPARAYKIDRISGELLVRSTQILARWAATEGLIIPDAVIGRQR